MEKPLITFHEGGDSWDVRKAQVRSDQQHLAIIQDIHCGNPAFKRKSFEKFIEFVKENGALWIYNGDGPENATKQSKGEALEQTMTVNEQLKYLYSLFCPIKDYCIGWNKGNHDDRTKKGSDFDFSEELADRLGITNTGYETFSIIANRDEKNGGTSYGVYTCHSSTGSKNAGLALNKMQSDWSWMENIDIKGKGHDHQVGILPYGVVRMDYANKCVRERVVWLACPGSFLGRAKTYASRRPYSPTPNIYYSMVLDMRKGRKSVTAVQHEI